jgi:TRAP-type C4-dicarboxylate transport system substrate-binding protein
MKKVLLLVVAMGFLWGIIATNAKGAPIVLKGITHLPKNNVCNDPVLEFTERVNKRAQGRLVIDYIGGPEVISPFDQIHALKGGTIDMILYYPFAYMASLMPESYCKGISELTEWEERKTGAFKLWSEIFEKRVNAKYLGRFHNIIRFYIYSKRKIEKLDDFRGKKIRVMPLYVPFINALGSVPITIPLTETYTSLERGVVDGVMFPKFGMTGMGWQEVTRYVLNDGVLQMEPATMVNLDKWNKIPKDLQELIMDVMIDMEYVGTLRMMLVEEKEDTVRKAAGMQFVHLPPGEAEKYGNLAYEKTWGFALEKAPENGPKLKELTSRKALPKGSFPWM